MGEIYHCPDYLKAHTLFKDYGCSLQDLSERDYPGKNYFNQTHIPAIDLDSYEKQRHRNQDCTSDAVIGIADLYYSSLKNKRLLLTEFRMGYKNVNNLDFKNIRRKYTHSYDILRQYDHEVKVDERFALVFTKDIASLAKRRISSLSRGSSKKEVENLELYWPESFCNYINYDKPIPVVATDETKAKVATWCVNTYITCEDLIQIYEELETYWWKINGEKLIADQMYIAQHIKPFLSTLQYLDGEDPEMYQLVKNEINTILSSL